MYSADSSIIGYQPIRSGWHDLLTQHGAVPDADTILTTYDHWCQQYNLDPNLLIAQACHEATYFTSTRWTQESNPAGLGITADNTPPNPFKTPQEGIQAHAEHVCCYAYNLAACPVDHTQDDQGRFIHMADRRHTFHEGLPTLAGLESRNHWADPGTGYIDSICAIANNVADAAPPAPGGTMNIVDLRNQLYRNPNGGPAALATARTGIVVHYNGPPPNPDAVTQYTNDAVYHANKDWGQGNYGDGIMYHWGIGGDGTAYQLRDENAALWHCGTQENYTAIAINVNIGDGQHATPAQIATLVTLCDEKRAQYGIELARTFGHQELSPTSCPGTLMADFIYPYRDGTIGGTNVTTAFKDPVTGHLVANAMLDFFSTNGGVAVLGRPLTDEYQGVWPDDPKGSPKRTMQIFERDVCAFFPENKDPYRVQALRLGAKFAAENGFSGEGIPTLPSPLPMKRSAK